MAGSARSLQTITFSGLRVASTNYYPAHSKNGVNISQRCTINAFLNVASRDGEGRRDVVQLTAWGKLGDTCAKSMSPGKEFHCSAKLKTFEARVFHNDAPIIAADGTAITTRKTGFSITELLFGEESAKHIANEIQSGIRPIDWNQAGPAGYAAWREKLKMRNTLVFDPTQPVFGYAKVFLPQGPGIGAYVPQTMAVPATAPAAAPVFAPPTGVAVEAAVVNAAGQPAAVSAALFQPPQTAAPVAPAQMFAPAAAPVVAPPAYTAPVGV